MPSQRITLTSTDIEGVPAVRITEHWPYNAAPRFVTLTLEELHALELAIHELAGKEEKHA
jgi:hypothetical protein